jgi:hypothetical protein
VQYLFFDIAGSVVAMGSSSGGKIETRGGWIGRMAVSAAASLQFDVTQCWRWVCGFEIYLWLKKGQRNTK